MTTAALSSGSDKGTTGKCGKKPCQAPKPFNAHKLNHIAVADQLPKPAILKQAEEIPKSPGATPGLNSFGLNTLQGGTEKTHAKSRLYKTRQTEVHP
jgi:hypothetical protein